MKMVLLKSRRSRIIGIIILLVVLFFVWFFTREIQYDLPYKLSGSEILETKEKCTKLAESKIKEWEEFGNIELVGSGFSEYKGFCYLEYLHYFDDWTAKKLYNTTDEKLIITRKWPENMDWYQRGFNMFINGKKIFYQNTF